MRRGTGSVIEMRKSAATTPRRTYQNIGGGRWYHRGSRMRWLPAVLLLGACADFATPAELTKPTVLAVIADPPLVPPGAESALSVVLVGPDGPMDPDATTWKMIE